MLTRTPGLTPHRHGGQSLTALVFGLIALGALSLAVATDYWLFTAEPLNMLAGLVPEGEEEIWIVAKIHSGLWRACSYYDDLPEEEMEPSVCTTIGYFQVRDRMDGADTTTSILRAIRKASPAVVITLLILALAFGFSTVGIIKGDMKTLVAAIFYVISALSLFMFMIFYVSVVKDEVAHRRKPDNAEKPRFTYKYGWAFLVTCGSFMAAMVAAVTNINAYVWRYPNPKAREEE